MAAPRLLKTLCLRPFPGYVFARHSSLSLVTDTKKKVVDYVRQSVAKMEWRHLWNDWRIEKMNERFGSMEARHGKFAGAAYYTQIHKGGVRFHGHQDWIRPVQNRINSDFLKYKDVPIECVDLSQSEVNYNGLSPILELEELQYLNLSGCPYIDDWCLGRLHMLGNSLEVLILKGCPQITERGLACLHQLPNLKHLDVSDLPRVSHKGLTSILLEEMMPACEVVMMDYSKGLQEGETGTLSEV
ncbi:distal membrane-arm assembly complex protein 2-like isoform X3 [Rana temporaria]|uniref:distal membrane-arm assembly complex protein 2-like isoform X3 n=1 Tax=Rana temporaria TaxID=8407 RepID=UPI001AAD532F|nr:distal membrane-arm assembly complex protein 2-like isoform X3 [Rana temporaria]